MAYLLKIAPHLITIILICPTIASFSTAGAGGGSIAFDRFKALCPADPSCISQFHPSLIPSDTDSSNSSNDDEIWVAVYRSNNNLPSVILKDDFLTSMTIATTPQSSSHSTSSLSSTSKIETPLSNAPVAVARLCRSSSSSRSSSWVLDSMRCSLKKEDRNDDCDGGSEHAEAIAICIDELILHYLKNNRGDDGSNGGGGDDSTEDNNTSSCGFSGMISCKGTLVSSPLLEERGFEPVTELRRDMATHVANLDKSMKMYANRVAGVGTNMSPGVRDRALAILGWLGRLDANEERLYDVEQQRKEEEDDIDDPWASFKNLNGV